MWLPSCVLQAPSKPGEQALTSPGYETLGFKAVSLFQLKGR